MIGVWQLVLVLLIVFTIFGTGKLPNVMKDVGKGIRNLKKGLADDEYGEDTTNVKKIRTIKRKFKSSKTKKKPKANSN